MAKLYSVGIEGTVYVLADDEESAVEVAVQSVERLTLDECGIEVHGPTEIKKGHKPPEGWEDSAPFCDDDHKDDTRTVKELIEALEEEEIVATEDDIVKTIEFLKTTNCISYNLVAGLLERQLKDG